jgi:hypothetical protein
MMMDGICSVDPNFVSKNEFFAKRREANIHWERLGPRDFFMKIKNDRV